LSIANCIDGFDRQFVQRTPGNIALDKKSSDSLLKVRFGVTFLEIASDAKFMSMVTLYKSMGESRWGTLDSPDAIK